MKKLALILIATAALMFVVSGCKKDEPSSLIPSEKEVKKAVENVEIPQAPELPAAKD